VETEAFPFCSPYLTSRAVMKISAIPALFDFLHPPIRCQRGPSSTPPPWLAARCALQRLYTLLTTTVGFRTCECAPRPVQTPRTPVYRSSPQRQLGPHGLRPNVRSTDGLRLPYPSRRGPRSWLRNRSLVYRGSEAMASGCFSAHTAVRLVASGIYLLRDIPI
jgi:hypothetical protein